jgi:hypothetical protein
MNKCKYIHIYTHFTTYGAFVIEDDDQVVLEGSGSLFKPAI